MRIFLSYRRQDAGGHAGRLYDALAARFGPASVFHDVSTLQPGADFAVQVSEAVASSDVTLVVVGPTWLSAAGPAGRRRIDDAGDYVRLEVSTALDRGGAVVPVLVAGAELPRPEELPDDLRGLSARHAVTLHDATWSSDVDAFVRRLAGSDAERPSRKGWTIVVAVAVVAAVAATVTWVLLDGTRGRAQTSPPAATLGPSASSTAPQRPPACSSPDASWTRLATVPNATVRMPDVGLDIDVVAAAAMSAGAMWDLVIQTRGTSVRGVVGTQDYTAYHNDTMYESVVVDGTRAGPLSCFSLAGGDENLTPGSSNLALVGFDIPDDPQSAEIILELAGGRAVTVTTPE